MNGKTRRRFLQKVGSCAVSAGAISVFSPLFSIADNAQPDRPPNILFFFPDQHRFDWTGLNPEVPVRTPFLNALAQRGVRFTNALCPSPLCAPSRAALASGKNYDRCGVASNKVNYPLDQKTFYLLLRDAGYHVMGCGKFDLHKATSTWGLDGKNFIDRWGFSDGIDSEGKWDAINSGSKTPKGPYMAFLQSKKLLYVHVADFRRRHNRSVTGPTPLPETVYCDNWIADNGLRLLSQAPGDKPWFLQVNYTGPHEPWDITKRMEQSCRRLTGFPQPNGNTEFDAETHIRIRQNYSAMVENIDRTIGIYINELKKRGELDRTVIVYSSDHGEMLGDHNLWGKTVPYQPSVGVPLLIAGPGIRQGFVLDEPSTTLDLTATFLDFARLPIPKDMESRSMKRLLDGTTDHHRDFVYSGFGDWRLVFDGRYKLIVTIPGSETISTWKNLEEESPVLFDLVDDPLENRNIARQVPYIVAKLKALLPGV